MSIWPYESYPHLKLDTVVLAAARIVLKAGLAGYDYWKTREMRWCGVCRRRELWRCGIQGDLMDSTRAIGKEAVERMEVIEGGTC